MKPDLNTVVYTIYEHNITKTRVAFIGNKSFITEHFKKGYDYGYEFDFNDFGNSWFTSLSEAKKKIIEDNECCKLVKLADDYWTGVDKDDTTI